MRFPIVLALCLIAGEAVAQSAWSRPEVPTELGFLAMQCDQREFCFAIACPNRELQLVNVSPGGGPYGNPDFGAAGSAATLVVGGQTFALSFKWDDSILPLVGSAGSRSALPVGALTALAERNGRIQGTTTGPVAATIASSGLKRLLPEIARSCGLGDLPRQ